MNELQRIFLKFPFRRKDVLNNQMQKKYFPLTFLGKYKLSYLTTFKSRFGKIEMLRSFGDFFSQYLRFVIL